MIIAIVGSRDYPLRGDVIRFVRNLVTTEPDAHIISGGAPGVDTWAIDAAFRYHFSHMVYPANWRRYGRRAGHLRNITLAEKADRVVAFWDGVSKGTHDTITLARERGKPVEVITPDPVAVRYLATPNASM